MLRRRLAGWLTVSFAVVTVAAVAARAVTETDPPIRPAVEAAPAPATAATETNAPPPQAPLYPPPPADVRAAKAYAVLDRHCARCHQVGKLEVPVAANPLANILALDEVARHASLVNPGVPDASELYNVMLRPHPVVALDAALEVTELQAVRDWISDLPPRPETCGGREVVSQEAVERSVMQAIVDTPAEKRKDLRFVTLAHLSNACVADDAMAGYRQAVTKLVNTLSWAAEPVRAEAFGPQDSILKLDLGALGWVGAHWDSLIAVYPFATLASSRLTDEIRRLVGHSTPAIRADWFAYAATATPLYARLLGLPGRLANLQRILNVDIEADIRTARTRRAAVTQSKVMRWNRLVERHPTRNGSLWLAYDFGSSDGRQNILANPLGPTATPVVKVPFKHDELRALFTLPNGFLAFSINDARGDRLETAAEALEHDALGWAIPTGNIAGCMACHRNGPFPVKDTVRAATEADVAAPKDLRDQILALYAPHAEIDQLVSEDEARYGAAMRRVGIDPDLMIEGLEPVTALAAEYTRHVDLGRIAAEAGLSREETQRRLAMLPEELQLSARRLHAATARRGEADRVLARIAPDRGGRDAAVVVAQPPAEPEDGLELLLWSHATVYEAGQLATFHARSSRNCYLTLYSVDRSGQATVLFPNEFQPDNLLPGGKEMMLPAQGSAYQFRVREKGRETLVGVCDTKEQAPPGIQHDFERQRFTMLGDWRVHLGQLPKANGRAASPPAGRRARGRAAVQPSAPTADQLARTAITYEVR